MFRNLAICSVLASTILVTPLRGEKPNMPPDALRKTATHVITGKVAAIYVRTETTDNWQYTKYATEIRVEECEKGDGIKKGDLVYIRYFQRAWVGQGSPPPSSSGHRGLPSDGESLRVYLARNAYDGFGFENKDGGFNVIGANGFEKLKSDSKK